MSSDQTPGDGGAGNPISNGIDAVAGALGQSEELSEAQDALETAKGLVDTAGAALGTAQQLGGVADALGRGNLGGAVSSLGNLGGATGGLADAAKYLVPEGEVREVLETVGQVARGVQDAANAIGGVMDAFEDLGSLFGGANKVTYHFTHGALPDHVWSVRHVRLEQALNEPYRAEVQVASTDTDLDVGELLGRGCMLSIERGSVHHVVRGIVAQIDEGSLRSGENEARMRLVVVPALALLELRKNTRIFQNLSVPDILKQVLREDLEPYEREARLELDASYLPREYCVQYEETDLAFLHRLMEEEGIAYTFDHSGDAEVMVLRDANRRYEEVETLDGNPIPYTPDDRQIGSSEPIQDFHPIRRLVTTRTVVRDFDWTRQGSMRLESDKESEDHRGPREAYEHRRSLTITSYDQGVQKYQAHDAARQAQIRHELYGRDARMAAGVSRVIGLAPGLHFEMTGHPNMGADGKYMITRVIHESLPLPGSDGASQHDPFHNRFECIPVDVPYRPDRVTPKPRIHSMQTAVVVGPAGEEIHTDEHGRIKVQFHWDRYGANDERSSCWVRVQQPWAGSGWGFSFIPRVDMEVVVSFLEGDPDRPLVVGSVYNGTNRPPYTLPAEKTKSTIKTSSSPHNGGSNELRFEDKAGSEEIYVHAQRDYNESVERNHSTSVKGNQSNSVGGNQNESVKKNQKIHVGEDQELRVVGQRSIKVEKKEEHSVLENRIHQVGGTENIQIEEHQNITVVKGHRAVMTEVGGQSFISKGEFVVDQNGKNQLVLGSEGIAVKASEKLELAGKNGVSIESGVQIVAEVGASSITMTPASIVISSPNIVLMGVVPVTIMPMTLTPTVLNSGGGGGAGSGADVNGDGAGPQSSTPGELTQEEQDALEQARIAQAAYGGLEVPEFERIPGQSVVDPVSGYEAHLYRSARDPNRYVLAYAGTNPYQPGDLTANGSQPFGLSQQHLMSVMHTDRVREYVAQQGGSLELTGHSLGGGLAALNGARTRLPTNTFNAAGVSDATLAMYGAHGRPQDRITNWSAPNDWLTDASENNPVTGRVMPNPLGNQRSVVPRRDDGSVVEGAWDSHDIGFLGNGLARGGTTSRGRGQY